MAVEPPTDKQEGSTTWPSGQVERRRSAGGGPSTVAVNGSQRFERSLLDAMLRRLNRTPRASRIRRQTAEHPFGTLKAWMGATHRRVIQASIATRNLQRIEVRLRTRSGRPVKTTPLTGRCRARAGARTARPDEESVPMPCPLRRSLIKGTDAPDFEERRVRKRREMRTEFGLTSDLPGLAPASSKARIGAQSRRMPCKL
jgi:hypothetical protein